MQSSAIQLDVGTLRLDFAEPSIEPGRGAHRLRIPFTYRAVPDPGDLVGRVVALTGSARDGDGMQWLGDLAPLPLYVYPDQGSQQLGLALSDHQLLSLDQSHPHDIELHLDLVASLPSQDTPPRPVSVQYRIARRQWAELTERLGTHVGIYVRVPVPAFEEDNSQDPTPILGRAVGRLRDAKRLLANHEWERCVGVCRAALELLRDAARTPEPADITNVKRNRTQDERWAALLHDAWSLTSAANHDDAVTSQFRWTRADADAAVAITAALLARHSAVERP